MKIGPLQYGFDYSYGFLHGQIDKYTHHYKNGDRSWHRNDKFIDEQGHSLDLITAEAIKFIQMAVSELKHPIRPSADRFIMCYDHKCLLI